MSDSSFTRKRLRITFLIKGSTSAEDSRVTVTDLRVSCQVVNAGLEGGVMCSLRIEGMNISHMNRLSMVQAGIVAQNANTVTVEACDTDDNVWKMVFYGSVVGAFADFNSAPNTAFIVTAQTMAQPSTMPITPTAFKGSVAVADIMKAIADKVGLSFQNNGVTAVMNGSITLNGSGADQMQAISQASRVSYIVATNVLSIWPATGPTRKVPQVTISADTGMIGYPAYAQYGVTIRTLFNSAIGFQSVIKLDSKYAPAAWVNEMGQLNQLGGNNIFPPSNGIWVAYRVQHDLQSEIPGGEWTTYIEAQRQDLAGSTVFVK
ncbi:baseplate hub protein [Komagataeibacter europaeus]|uniref:baseplate hub protein n=1 Tax=Komagataeibacter europaeus TaxID=33995 RepID=UPI002174FD36|nr:hypothetical protein [Komagataeibacter europaeus]